MDIQIDSREHKTELKRICAQFDRLGIKYFISKVYVGDYVSLDNPRLVVDRKKDLQEISGNVCQQHERFKRELEKAAAAGIKIIILCEHGGGIKDIEDVKQWENPRRKIMIMKLVNGRMRPFPKYPYAITGAKLYKILCTIRDKYNVDFVFCDKRSTGKHIAELLGGGADD